MKPPPVREITSGSGSLTEGIATFVEHHIQQITTKHDTYIQDTPDFLRVINNINKGPKLGKQAILASLDVDGMFTNIVHSKGLQHLQKQLYDQNDKNTPIELIMKMMEVILYNSIFSFHDSLWKKNIGAAMGSKPIPAYADNFMAEEIDPKVVTLAVRYDKENQKALQLLKRFLDDMFALFNGTTKMLHKLLDQINQIKPNIDLTMIHTSAPGEALEDKCKCESRSEIPFLGTLCRIKNGKIKTALYKKPTDRNQYLLPDSCHPKQTTRAIPKSLGLRIVRVCSDPVDRDKRLNDLKEQLVERGYNQEMVQSSLGKVKKIPRNLALKRVQKKTTQTKRPVYAVTYDPRLPYITALQAKHWRSMASKNRYLSEVFPNPPLAAFKRQPNIRSMVIRANVSKAKKYPTRYQRGMTKCNTQKCTACA